MSTWQKAKKVPKTALGVALIVAGNVIKPKAPGIGEGLIEAGKVILAIGLGHKAVKVAQRRDPLENEKSIIRSLTSRGPRVPDEPN